VTPTDHHQATAETAGVVARLSMLDRFLPVWIALAMAAGLGLGSLIPGLNDGLDELSIGTVSLPIAAGLLLMMYPVLAKVRYEELGRRRADGVSDRRFYGVSIFLSWAVGPLFMFALAWAFLADQPVLVVALAVAIVGGVVHVVSVGREELRLSDAAVAEVGDREQGLGGALGPQRRELREVGPAPDGRTALG